ncbi:hypothetical protein bAD24_p00765 (plasmid) [Burkholderia sp. AD24]|nr:hypothetical protein bAD24_p00765 [Burkholderia sp. AD24]
MNASLFYRLCALFALLGLALFAYGITAGMKTDRVRALAALGGVMAFAFSFVSVRSQIKSCGSNGETN